MKLSSIVTWKCISKYVYDIVSNVSHFPAVNQTVERWIETHQCEKGKPSVGIWCDWSRGFSGNPPTHLWQITNQKQKIDVNCSESRFSQPPDICHFFILCCLLYLKGLDLRCMASYSNVYFEIKKVMIIIQAVEKMPRITLKITPRFQ